MDDAHKFKTDHGLEAIAIDFPASNEAKKRVFIHVALRFLIVEKLYPIFSSRLG